VKRALVVISLDVVAPCELCANKRGLSLFEGLRLGFSTSDIAAGSDSCGDSIVDF
jgi:hypothetical protein